MKKSFSALLIIFSLFLSFACKGNVNPSKPEEITTGTITGKAVYQNAAESSGITVTLEKTDGLRSLCVVRSIELEFDDFSARSVAGNSTTDSEGNYTFTDVEEGVYTIYASSKDSTEKAVTTNVVVERNASVTAEDLKLTATGNISGKITLDNSETDSYGFIIYIAGTSYSAATDIDGSFLITGIPAKSGYHLLVTKQQLTYMFEQPVTVTAKETVSIPAINFTTSEITAGYTDGKDGTSINWLGSFDSENEIEEPKYLDAYFNTEDGCSYIYDGEKWNLLAKGNAESQDEHSHTYSDEWSSNDDFHWHIATCEHGEQITDFGIHSYSFNRILTPAECLVNGSAEYVCICGKKKEVSIPAIGHSFSEEWSYDKLSHWYDSICKHVLILDKEEHSFTEYEVFEATDKSNKIEKRNCIVCNYSDVHEYYGTMLHEHSYDDQTFVCICGKTKELSVQEFLKAIGNNPAYITADPSKPGIIHSEKFIGMVNIYGISISGEFNEANHFSDSLIFADLRGLDTHDITNMSYMFSDCYNLEALDITNFDTSNVTDMSHMFNNCYSLKDDIKDGIAYFGVDIFYDNATSMTSFSVEKFDTSNVTDMSHMFLDCYNLKTLDVSNFVTSNVTDMSYMFCDCHILEALDISNFNTSQVTDMSGMFTYCENLKTLDVSNFNTSQVTDMNHMFAYCYNLKTLDVSNFVTTKVTDMSCMFIICSGLTNLDVSNFDTANVTNMNCLFAYCENLPSIEVTNFNTSKVTNMSRMFANCENLSSIEVTNFNTSKVTNMSYMFCQCKRLNSLDVSNFDTSNVTDMSHMFGDCGILPSLDISNFDTSNVKYMRNMFDRCAKLKTIFVSDLFVTSSVIWGDDMFKYCDTLVGAISYNPIKVDSNYANYTTGYFTLKQ